MATYEIYLGGPSTGNESRAFFPKRTFSDASGSVFARMRPAAHKGSSAFFLNRVLDFGNDKALKHFVRELAAAGTPLTTGDVLGSLVIPQHTLVLGAAYDVQVAAPAALAITPSIRGGGPAFGAIAAGTVSKGYAPAGVTTWRTTNAAAANDTAYFPAPAILDLTLGTVPPEGFGDLRLEIGLVLLDLSSGEY